MGKPVAFDAKAEERDTRGFISMMTMRPVSGCTANCTLEPPVATPTRSSTASDAARMRWYSRSVNVWAGATVMESPVCTPMGSRFSMEHTMMPLPAASRMTSISYSFQPSMDSSTSTSPAGESSSPWETMRDELILVARDAAAGAAHGERRAQYHGEPSSPAMRRASSTE